MTLLSLLKPKRVKTSRKASLKKSLDAIISRKVRDRDGNHCKKCGRTPCYHHHIFGKAAHPSTRWEIDNGVSVCFRCHRDAHASPEDFRRWVISWMGEVEYEALYVKAQMRASFKVCDLELLLWAMRKAA